MIFEKPTNKQKHTDWEQIKYRNLRVGLSTEGRLKQFVVKGGAKLTVMSERPVTSGGNSHQGEWEILLREIFLLGGGNLWRSEF